MYKIYINQTTIHFKDNQHFAKTKLDVEHLKAKYYGKKASLLNYIDAAEKGSGYKTITLFSDDLEQMINDFFGLFKIVQAAGGRVTNSNGDTLMIYRYEHWDLPKGKIDPGESPDEAAVREVQEETGLQNIELGPLLHTSYHFYRNRSNVRCLKPTFWYEMTTTDMELTPQAEEAIEKAVWMNKEEFLKSGKVAYGSIYDVLRA